jgi:hypothetical protein
MTFGEYRTVPYYPEFTFWLFDSSSVSTCIARVKVGQLTAEIDGGATTRRTFKATPAWMAGASPRSTFGEIDYAS